MAIVSAICASFKTELAAGTHVLATDTIKVALYTSSATLDSTTTVYTTTNEVVGTGYSAGGVTLTGNAVTTSGTKTLIDFADASWPGSSFTARGALLYNSSKSNKAIAVLDFGSDKNASGGTLRITWPVPDADNAIIRFD